MAYTSTQNLSAHSTSLSEESDAATGSGGDVMGLWSSSRLNKIEQLGGAEFTNNSSFGTPAAYYQVSGFSKNHEDTEKFTGVSAEGQVLKADGTPMDGTAMLERDGHALATKSVAGLFIIATSPPASVTAGPDGAYPTYDFRFAPSSAGLDVFTESAGVSYSLGTVRYGAVTGTITDYDGNPLEGEVVVGSGAFAKTDANGEYTLDAPGNTEVDLTAIGATDTFTPSGGETITQDYQASKIVVEVVTPELEPVVGVPVRVGSDKYVTDEEGRVEIDPAYIVNYEVLVSDAYLLEIDVTSQGQSYREVFGDEDDKAGLNVLLVDGRTGQPVRDLPAEFPATETYAVSAEDGRLKLFTDQPDAEDAVLIGDGDPRYQTVLFSEITLAVGETERGEVTLEPKTQVSSI